jgi:archaellum component FlaG (FlaF/FlaG flagellin family)
VKTTFIKTLIFAAVAVGVFTTAQRQIRKTPKQQTKEQL